MKTAESVVGTAGALLGALTGGVLGFSVALIVYWHVSDAVRTLRRRR
jgi:gas vesicle protein